MRIGYQVILLMLWLGFVAAFCFNLPQSSSEWASWVQAVGSIAAVVAAVLVWQSQRNHGVKLHKKQRISQLDGVVSIFESFLTAGENSVQFIKDAGRTNEKIRKAKVLALGLRRPLPSLRAIPLHEFPYSHIAGQVLSFEFELNSFIDRLDSIGALDPTQAKSASVIGSYLKSASSYVGNMQDIKDEAQSIFARFDGEILVPSMRGQ